MRRAFMLTVLCVIVFAITSTPSTTAQDGDSTVYAAFGETVTVTLPNGVYINEFSAERVLIADSEESLQRPLGGLSTENYIGELWVRFVPDGTLAEFLATELGSVGIAALPELVTDYPLPGLPREADVLLYRIDYSTDLDRDVRGFVYAIRLPDSDNIVMVSLVVGDATAAPTDIVQNLTIAATLDDHFRELFPSQEAAKAVFPNELLAFDGALRIFAPPIWRVNFTEGNRLGFSDGGNAIGTVSAILTVEEATEPARLVGAGERALREFAAREVGYTGEEEIREGRFHDVTYTYYVRRRNDSQGVVAVRQVFNMNLFFVGNAFDQAPVDDLLLRMLAAIDVDAVALADYIGTEALIRPVALFNRAMNLRVPLNWQLDASDMPLGVVRFTTRAPLTETANGYPDQTQLTITTFENTTISTQDALNGYLASNALETSSTFSLNLPLSFDALVPVLGAAGVMTNADGFSDNVVVYVWRDGNYIVTFAFTYPVENGFLNEAQFHGFMRNVTAFGLGIENYLNGLR